MNPVKQFFAQRELRFLRIRVQLLTEELPNDEARIKDLIMKQLRAKWYHKIFLLHLLWHHEIQSLRIRIMFLYDEIPRCKTKLLQLESEFYK